MKLFESQMVGILFIAASVAMIVWIVATTGEARGACEQVASEATCVEAIQ